MNVSGHYNVSSGNQTLDQSGRRFLNILIFMEASFSVLVVFGNFFVIALIQKKKLLGRSTNVFVFSIAVADFLNGSISIPGHILSLVYGNATAMVYLCKGYRFTIYLTKTVVPYTIVFMTGEKVMRILCPTREIVTVARCMFFTSLLWFFAASFNIWCVVLYTVEFQSPNVTAKEEELKMFDTRIEDGLNIMQTYSCSLSSRFQSYHRPFLIVDLMVLFVIPVMSALCLYIILIIKYFTILRERIITYFYVVKLVIVLFINVFLTHLPFEAMTIYENLNFPPSLMMHYVTNVITSFHFTRGIWNIVIYGYFKHYVCRKRHMASIRATPSVDNRYKLRVPSFRFRTNGQKTNV